MCECWSVGVGFLVIGATGKEWGFAVRLWESIYFGEQVDGTVVTEALAGRRGQ